MFTYGEAREHGDFEYGVVTYPTATATPWSPRTTSGPRR